MSKPSPSYRRVIEKVAYDMGAITVEWLASMKHQRFKVTMPDGGTAICGVSKGTRNDDYKVKGWARQNINRALRQQTLEE